MVVPFNCSRPPADPPLVLSVVIGIDLGLQCVNALRSQELITSVQLDYCEFTIVRFIQTDDSRQHDHLPEAIVGRIEG